MAPSLNRKIIIITAACILAFNSFMLVCLYSAQSPKFIRVSIIQNAESLSLKAAGSYEITGPGGQILFKGVGLNTTVTTYRDKILLAGMSFNQDKIFIHTLNQEPIIINARKFRGSIQFIREDDSRLRVINDIELEDYIRGILYHEASHYWPIEALKAQALVSRTYALYQIEKNKYRDYDVTADIYSQVYGGRTSERFRTDQAVKSTRGEVLTYEDEVFPAYFHATCAGHTEDASLLWDIDLVPLKGVPCNYCKGSPHFNWHTVLSIQEIEKPLAGAGYKVKKIKNIMIMGRDKSGRITDLKIVSEDKDSIISAKDFRNIIGPNIIRSTNFKVRIVETDVVFEGLGWGHGVGLCQWGAYFMAKEGHTYQQILEYYYPGTKITNY